MKKIDVGSGYIALVDEEDYERAGIYSWHTRINKSGTVYACRNAYLPFSSRKVKLPYSPYVSMHSFIMQTEEEVDHRDGNGLNNQKYNLRIVTRKQNSYNRVGRVGRKWKGVSFMASKGKWRAVIQPDRKQIHLGLFGSPEEAARRYDEEALKLWGEYALLNYQRRDLPNRYINPI